MFKKYGKIINKTLDDITKEHIRKTKAKTLKGVVTLFKNFKKGKKFAVNPFSPEKKIEKEMTKEVSASVETFESDANFVKTTPF